ncbi:MAG TPA: hypothetical protein VJ453_07840, partial [Terriglobales bacterium]|nr:hypothetical protein [Terriglobales bacterium]
LTLAAALSPSLARIDDAVKGQKWCNSTAPAVSTQRSTTATMPAMRPMGLRDWVGVVTMTVSLARGPAELGML